jgi:hypothetical protein
MFSAIALGGGLLAAGTGAALSGSGRGESQMGKVDRERPSVGTTHEKTNDINVNVYLGDPLSESAKLLMHKELRGIAA